MGFSGTPRSSRGGFSGALKCVGPVVVGTMGRREVGWRCVAISVGCGFSISSNKRDTPKPNNIANRRGRRRGRHVGRAYVDNKRDLGVDCWVFVVVGVRAALDPSVDIVKNGNIRVKSQRRLQLPSSNTTELKPVRIVYLGVQMVFTRSLLQCADNCNPSEYMGAVQLNARHFDNVLSHPTSCVASTFFKIVDDYITERGITCRE